MKSKSALLACVALTACGAAPSPAQTVEDTGEVEQATTTINVVLAGGGSGQNNPFWQYVPNSSLGPMLGDWDAANPNASYVYVPPNSQTHYGTHEDYQSYLPPSDFACSLMDSGIKDVLLEFKYHTGGAAEEIWGLWNPATSPAGVDAILTCTGVVNPFRPVGHIAQCAQRLNPLTHLAWTKQDVGCGPFGNPPRQLLMGFNLFSNGGIVIEAMRVTVRVGN